jgi:hypothetical protein
MPYMAPSYSHWNGNIRKTLNAAQIALDTCSVAVDEGSVDYRLINGWVEKPVFKRRE